MAVSTPWHFVFQWWVQSLELVLNMASGTASMELQWGWVPAVWTWRTSLEKASDTRKVLAVWKCPIYQTVMAPAEFTAPSLFMCDRQTQVAVHSESGSESAAPAAWEHRELWEPDWAGAYREPADREYWHLTPVTVPLPLSECLSFSLSPFSLLLSLSPVFLYILSLTVCLLACLSHYFFLFLLSLLLSLFLSLLLSLCTSVTDSVYHKFVFFFNKYFYSCK